MARCVQSFGEVSFGNFCAGTDSPRLVIDQLLTTLVYKFSNDFKEALDFSHPVHAFSAEVASDKCVFLRGMYDYKSSEQLYGGVRTLSKSTVLDYSKKEDDELKEAPSFSMAVGGFPCKDVSSYNTHRAMLLSGVNKGTGKTGGALAGIVKAIRKHGADEMPFSLLENVLGLGVAHSEKGEDG